MRAAYRNARVHAHIAYFGVAVSASRAAQRVLRQVVDGLAPLGLVLEPPLLVSLVHKGLALGQVLGRLVLHQRFLVLAATRARGSKMNRLARREG